MFTKEHIIPSIGPSGKNVYLDDIASPWLYISRCKKTRAGK
jgi:hypothetical protein